MITVDRDGVLGFDWRRATIQTAVLEDDVALLPFEQILERAQQQLHSGTRPKKIRRMKSMSTYMKYALRA